MKNNRWLLPLALIAATVLGEANAEHPVAEAQRYRQQANQAYRVHDFEGFRRSMQHAYELNPASLITRYNLACGFALTGRTDEAFELLEELTRARVDFGMATDPDLATLRELPRFQKLVARLESSIVPVNNSSLLLSVEQFGLIPEGIAYDHASGRLFFGSMRNGDIYAVEAAGGYSKFASVGDLGAYAAIGMMADADRNVLWVVGTWFFLAEGYTTEQPLPSGLFGFDLATGQLEHRYPVADVDSTLNDVALAPNGDIYVSGTELQVLEKDSGALRPFATSPAVFGSNGLTLDPAGNRLFVSSYPLGLVAIDVESGTLRVLTSPPDRPLYGIDGLYWHEDGLIAVQNGVQPWRILRIELSEDYAAVTAVDFIEFANDTVTATTAVIDGQRLYYLGQGPSPQNPPAHFPASLGPYLGKTVIMTAALDEAP